MSRFAIVTTAISLFIGTSCWSQESDLDLVKQGMDLIYNFEFKQAQPIINQLEASSSSSSVTSLMKALQLFWEFYPIQHHQEQLDTYYQYLEQAYERSTDQLENQPNNPEALFLAMASQGLLAESYAETGRSFKAVGAAKKAYGYLKRGMDKMDRFDEFYVSTGLYNYYREYYPDAYPIYKPFMSFFMKGNKSLGIKQLETASRNASIAHVIAGYYLSYIYMRYEYIPKHALDQGYSLHQEYPNNDLFTAIYLESLIINQRFKEAAPLARKLQRNSNPFIKVYGELFTAIIQEKDHQNVKHAERLYHKSLELIDSHEMNQPHLEALAFLGLGRIYRQKNDPQARDYFKESLEKAYTKSLKEEAKSYLN